MGISAGEQSTSKPSRRRRAEQGGLSISILIVEDGDADYDSLTQHLFDIELQRPLFYELRFTRVTRLSDALLQIEENSFDVVILDLSLPDSEPSETVTYLRTFSERAALIVLSAVDDLALGLKAVTEGAHDFLVKGTMDGDLLLRSLLYSHERRRREVDQLTSELEVRHAERLKSIGLLAGGVAHDFNNLLMALMGHTQMLQIQLENDAVARPHLEKMESTIKAAAGLTRQLLAYAGKGSGIKEQLDVSECVRAAIDLLPTSVRKDSVLKVELWPSPLVVLAERAMLNQILLNLIWNAYEASFKNRAPILVRLAPHRVQSGTDAHAEMVMIQVSDKGTGMDAATKAKMFDPYFSTKEGGRGLGLASVWGIVRSLHGTVEVDSKLGEGTTITVLIPRFGAAEEDQASESAVVENTLDFDLDGPVLIVDDDPRVREVVAQLLDTHGVSVSLAEEGDRALHLLREDRDRFALILLDVSMPGLSGFEVYEQLRTLGVKAPVIFMSGFASSRDTSTLPHDGTHGFIAKPFQFEDLMKLVRSLIAGSSDAGPSPAESGEAAEAKAGAAQGEPE